MSTQRDLLECILHSAIEEYNYLHPLQRINQNGDVIHLLEKYLSYAFCVGYESLNNSIQDFILEHRHPDNRSISSTHIINHCDRFLAEAV